MGVPEKELFEAGSSFLAAMLITSVVYWLARTGSRIRERLEKRIVVITTASGLLVFTFIVVFREAVETVLFITPFLVMAPLGALLGSALGVTAAALLSYATRILGLRLDLKLFFKATSILLLLVASGLVGYAVHEYIEWLEEKGVELG